MVMSKTEEQKGGFEALPWKENAKGEPHKVGLELEMAGIDAETLARAVVSVVGGRVERDSAFYSRVVDTELGDFGIELDAELLKNRGYQKQLNNMGFDIGDGERRDQIEAVISRIAGLVVPLELVGPPVPVADLDRMDQIRQRLHQAGAKGTNSSPFYAFGMQINIDAASLEADHLLAMIRAFLLSYEWLKERAEVDLSRRISPYVQPYPEDYVVHVLQADYHPDIASLIDDFLKFTPTRNRPLDLLPLFAHIDQKRVIAAPVEHALIKPRPAFHYRLPNCLIDEPEWTLAEAWNDWVEVERLAADDDALREACRARLSDASALKHWLATTWRKIRS
jgi:hypothetical protein